MRNVAEYTRVSLKTLDERCTQAAPPPGQPSGWMRARPSVRSPSRPFPPRSPATPPSAPLRTTAATLLSAHESAPLLAPRLPLAARDLLASAAAAAVHQSAMNPPLLALTFDSGAGCSPSYSSWSSNM
ncbi:hypothetical protein M758_2G098500 [Ceratodon purpureus]|nr:hypothetical protein M758_2G098500 [Ceratodon purpureus]